MNVGDIVNLDGQNMKVTNIEVVTAEDGTSYTVISFEPA
jgi:hypothetical protein